MESQAATPVHDPEEDAEVVVAAEVVVEVVVVLALEVVVEVVVVLEVLVVVALEVVVVVDVVVDVVVVPVEPPPITFQLHWMLCTRPSWKSTSVSQK